MKPHKKNQASNFAGDSFSNRNDVRVPIPLHGQFCNVGFWEGNSSEFNYGEVHFITEEGCQTKLA